MSRVGRPAVETREAGRLDGDASSDVDQSESGSSLILALVYIVAMSLIVGALASWAMNDLNNTANFKNTSSRDYAATSATEVAIQSIRKTPLYSVTSSPQLGYCWTPPSGTVSQLTINGYTMAVWCTTVQNFADRTATRVVTFYTCLSSVTAVNCQASPVLVAQVAYGDYPPNAGPAETQTCTVWCGQSAVTRQWTWG